MGFETIQVIADLMLIPVVIALTGAVKEYFDERWIPLIPWLFAFVLSALSSLYFGWSGWLNLITETLLTTFVVATGSMGTWKIYHTTIKEE